MQNFSQDELKAIVAYLKRIQASYDDTKIINALIDKTDSYIFKLPQAPVQEAPIQTPAVS